MLNFRTNSTLYAPTSSGDTSFAEAWRVYPCPVGGVAASSSTGTTITFSAPHSFAIGDRPLRNPGTSTEFLSAVSAVTRLSITLTSSSPTVSAGDVFVNLGPDTGTTTPSYDAVRFGVYNDQLGTTAKSEVFTDASGTYEYYHRGSGGHWELFVNSGNPVGVVKGVGETPWYNTADYGAYIDGSTDDTIAINAASLAAGDDGTLFAPEGTSNITPLNAMSCNIMALQHSIWDDVSTSGGTAVTYRDGTGSDSNLRKWVRFPQVRKETREFAITGTSGSKQADMSTDIGILLENVKVSRCLLCSEVNLRGKVVF